MKYDSILPNHATGLRKTYLPKVDRLIEDFKEFVGIPNVYFESPEKIKMSYPCVRFCRRRFEPNYANNKIYLNFESFEATLIYRDPDSQFPSRMLMLPYCRHDRHYTANNLSHDVFVIYL